MAQVSVFQQPLDGVDIARGVAEDIARTLGDRLYRVMLYGSFARGEGHIDSDVDLLVVASEVRDEDNRLAGPLSELAGNWFLRGGRVVSIRVVSDAELVEAAKARHPSARQVFLRSAASEAKTILDAAA
jgi:predicted nucleotidyltransferase